MAIRGSTTQEPTYGADGARHGAVPYGLVITAAFAWRIAIIGLVLLSLFTALATLTTIVLPLLIAILICAPLERLVTRLQRRGVPRGAGAGIVLFGFVTIILGLFAIAGSTIVAGFDELKQEALAGFDKFLGWLTTGPLQLDQAQIDNWVATATTWLQENWAGVANGALSVTGTIGTMFAGIAIGLLALFFFMRDGRSMWLWAAKTLTGRNAPQVDNAGRNAWITLRRYTMTSAFVAFVDAVGIGLAAWLLGIPLVLPIMIMVFLFSFIPLFGATISGAIAVAVALVDGGWVTALIMLGAVIVVQQIEGSILYPWLFGKAVSIHPMVVLVSVSTGTLVAGLFGAVIAVPLVAFGYAFAVGLRKEYVVEEPPPISGQFPQLAARTRAALHLPSRKRAAAQDPGLEADAMTAEMPVADESGTKRKKRT
jgi:predicted PurR-regulated permease PerM